MAHRKFASKILLTAVALCAALILLPGASAPRNPSQPLANGYDMIPAHQPFNVAVADSDPAPPDSSAGAKMDLTLTGDVNRGSDIFSKRCSDCHGDDAMGDKAPKLVQNKILDDDNGFWSTVLDGRKKMPTFKMKLSSQDIADVRTFLQSLKGSI